MSSTRPPTPRSRLRAGDLLPVGTVGLRARRLRAGLSALGVAIGIAAIVAVLGITRSSQAELLAQIDRLGTDLLTVTNGRSIEGQEAQLPARAAGMLGQIDGVRQVAATAQLAGVNVYRSDKIPAFQTGALAVRACDPGLLATLDGRLRHGGFLNPATARYPTTVLGWQAATALGINRLDQPTRVWLGGRWFTVVGTLDPMPLAPELDRSALVGFPIATRFFDYQGHPSRIYLRTTTQQTTQVAGLLAATADPQHPEQVQASRPSDALTARVAAKTATTGLFLGLGAVALLVGGIGIANVMVIGVLERRSEIGLRRALGAARGHVAAQFVVESLLLATVGGITGVAIGAAITVGVADRQQWATQLPALALWGGLAAALAVGVVAGLYPALRAARLAPTDALRSV
jgi:putative ABC transport system permease protein